MRKEKLATSMNWLQIITLSVLDGSNVNKKEMCLQEEIVTQRLMQTAMFIYSGVKIKMSSN